MNNDLRRAKALLEEGNYTCVLCHSNEIHTSIARGVRPLLELETRDWSIFSAADKVIGKATAFLYVNIGIRAVYAPVVSEAALEVLQRNGVEVFYELAVPAIFNRTRTGYCPMETAVRDIDNLEEALLAIHDTIEKLHN